ncbi:MAG: hypothetical protein COB15_17440 [Flavobacteriales bacterium]|nr:MAG: hypothetical protein COB15_17440 [Flavobacteriales bacterium]
MKKLVIITLLLFKLSNVLSQSISNISYTPSNPTTIDTIYFYVDLMFPSSDCPISNTGSSIVGQTVIASSLHCVGMLATPCNTTDTFMVLPLASGNYTFDMTLSSGSGPAPCTPGIVASDNLSQSFTVSSLTGLTNEIENGTIRISPNPSNGVFILSDLKNTNLLVYDILGNELLNLKNMNQKYKLDLTNYPKGIFFLKTITNREYSSYRLIKK